MRVVDNVGFNVKKQDIPGGGSGSGQPLATPDWNQNDETAADYIKNRPFYEESLVSVPYLSLDDWYLYKVSDQIPTGDMPSANDQCYIEISGNRFSGAKIILVQNDYYASNEYMVVVALKDNVNVEGMIFPEKGTYFVKNPDVYISGFALGKATEPEITWDGNTGTIKQIEEKYIPEMNSVILKSTTADSTKKFKITVDDSGALTATEVTG